MYDGRSRQAFSPQRSPTQNWFSVLFVLLTVLDSVTSGFAVLYFPAVQTDFVVKLLAGPPPHFTWGAGRSTTRQDDYRLPEGVKRIGYDTDTGSYYFRDREGLVYKGPEGAEFGELTQVQELPVAVTAEDGGNDVEAAPARVDGYQPLAVDEHGTRHVLRGGAYRTLFPFFLIIAVILLLVWRLAFSPTLATPAPCPSTTIPYVIQSGDTCWNIVRQYNSTLDKFRIVNPKIVCSDLHPGDRVCIPDEGSSISRVF